MFARVVQRKEIQRAKVHRSGQLTHIHLPHADKLTMLQNPRSRTAKGKIILMIRDEAVGWWGWRLHTNLAPYIGARARIRDLGYVPHGRCVERSSLFCRRCVCEDGASLEFPLNCAGVLLARLQGAWGAVKSGLPVFPPMRVHVISILIPELLAHISAF